MAGKLNVASTANKIKGGKMIRFDDKLMKEIQRTVKNFNSKQKYNKYKTRGKGMLPTRLSASTIKDKYSDKSRKELLKQLKLYQSFGERDALDITNTVSRISKWEFNYFKSNLAKTKKFYDDEIADLERIIGDKPEYYLKQHNRLQTLIVQRKELDKDISTLTEDQIKGFRAYFNYAERSDIIKKQGFRLYLNQLERTMNLLGYDKSDIEELFKKFDSLTENEFTEMVRREDVIDDIYRMIYSPKGRGKYELLADEKDARIAVESIIKQADSLVAKYKTSD